MLPRRLFLQALFFLPLLACAEPASPWQKEILFQAPKIYPAPGIVQEGVEALFFEGLPFEGKPTRVFAYVGIPAHAAGEKVPGMVLVHGGGGTAFPAWVRLWTSRGYAAIAMDTCGSAPTTETLSDPKARPRHAFSGPPGWGGWEQTAKPLEDQWSYHAIADVLLAHSLLCSRPEVAADRIGITGISWGGYLTCIAAGVDERFKFAAPVYGCGWLGDNSTWLGQFQKLGPEAAQTWLKRWDPSEYLPRAKMPMLWVTGTNDFAYPMDSLQKSYWLPSGPRTLCVRVRMAHAHGGPGENPEEIHAFADHYLKGASTLTKVFPPELAEGQLRCRYETTRQLARAELNFTRDEGVWQKRNWETIPAEFSTEAHVVSAKLPSNTRVAYLNVIDEQGLVVSSEHLELAAPTN